MDLGAPTSYMALAEDTDVFSSDEVRVGKVEHVLADVEVDIFDGIVIDSTTASGGHRFVDAPSVERVYERGVVLNIDADAVEQLPEPSENPAVMEAGPDETVPDDLGDKLRHAWDRINGRG
jgi:hypothetical protein